MKLYLASGNAHKAQEMNALAAACALDVEIISAKAVGGMPAVEEDTQVKAPILPPAPVKAVTPPVQVIPPVLPKTIIPVPQLPRVTDPSLVRPAVTARGSGPQVSPPLRRVPRGTDRIEDTVRTAAAPANDDKTSPGVALPPSGGGRRVAAKQR